MPQYQNPIANLTPVVKNLLIINGIFFLATLAFGYLTPINLEQYLAAFYPASHFFRDWQIITYMFMHGSFLHIFSNMLGLLFIGPILEYTLGPKRFLQYYLICGVGALGFQYLVQAIEMHNAVGAFYINDKLDFPIGPATLAKVREIYGTPVLGASGAIFGLLIAVYLFYPNMEVYIYFIPIPVKIKYLVPLYVLWELYSGFRQSATDDVAHFAHIGGALVGFILIKLWRLQRPNNFF